MRFSQFILIGNYFPSNSILHRFDARTKILLITLFLGLVFYANNIFSHVILLGIMLIGVFLSRVPISFILKGLVPVIFFISFSVIIHLLITKNGDIILDLGFIVIYSEGVRSAILISLRLILIVVSASILTMTTAPIDITIGLERLMAPLKLLKIPVGDVAFMMSVSLRFIPILLEETDNIIKSQEARGATIFYGPLRKRIVGILAIMIPLFISSMRRADQLAIAMESRGYRGSEGRTRVRNNNFTKLDLLFIPLSILMIVLIIQIRG